MQQHPQYLLDPKMLALSFDALILWVLGQPTLALQKSHEAVAWAQGLSHPYTSVSSLLLAAWLRVNLRDGEAGEEQIDILLPVAQTHGFVQYLAFGMLLRGGALITQRQSDEGVHLMFQGIEAMHVAKVRIGMSLWQGLLAAALGNLERTEDALAMIAAAETAMNNSGERFFEAEIYRIKGEILLSRKAKIKRITKAQKQRSESVHIHHSPFINPHSAESDAEACFLKAIDTARQQQAKSLELRAVMSLVRLRQQQVTKHDSPTIILGEAHNMLSEVYGWFSEGFENIDLQEARRLLEELKLRQ